MRRTENGTVAEWNLRYVAYATAHDNTPDEMLAEDRASHPGACMMEFMFWIRDRWSEWDRFQGRPPLIPHSDDDHRAFDRWLRGR